MKVRKVKRLIRGWLYALREDGWTITVAFLLAAIADVIAALHHP